MTLAFFKLQNICVTCYELLNIGSMICAVKVSIIFIV
jgi:hypothetical protein